MGAHQATVAETPQIFAGKKREAAESANGAGELFFAGDVEPCAAGLGDIFDDLEMIVLSHTD